MDAIARGLAVYLFLLLVFRLAGKRALVQITTFDFVILLIISEVVEEAMIDGDHSVTNSFLLILTLVGADVLLSLLTRDRPWLSKLVSGAPLVLVEKGRPIEERMHKSRVSEDDVLAAAREMQGLERMDQIKYAVLETDGKITIVPAESNSRG
jgi:uncharacterized membrane protein YcaP (DUF421 family)